MNTHPYGAADVLALSFALDVPGDLAAMESALDASERERAGRFVHHHHRCRFIVAHATARAALGRVFGTPPEAVRFVTGPQGKPAVVDAPTDVRFNLSHSAGRAVLAVTRGRDVGVDIEQEAPVDPLALAPWCFSPCERRALEAWPLRDRVRAFFRGWTRKESFVKAVGAGLSMPLDAFDVSLDDVDGNVLLGTRDSGVTPTLTIRRLTVPANYAGAIAVEGRDDWHLLETEVSWETLQAGALAAGFSVGESRRW